MLFDFSSKALKKVGMCRLYVEKLLTTQTFFLQNSLTFHIFGEIDMDFKCTQLLKSIIDKNEIYFISALNIYLISHGFSI